MEHIKRFKKYVNEKFYSIKKRKELSKERKALPDGSFPINDKQDLINAIRLQGMTFKKVSNKRKQEILKHIERRAKSLGIKLKKSEKGYWVIEK